jgi:PAS domain S-box-containing protein
MEDEQIITKYFNAIVDCFPFEVWFKDANGKYRIINKCIQNDLNRPLADIIGRNDYEIYPKNYADRYVDSDRAVIEEGLNGYYISEYKNKVYEEYKSPIFDKSDRLLGIAGFSKDITQTREIQNALMESERSKSALLSNLPGVAYRSNCDPDLQITFISEGCYELTGYRAEELLGQNRSYYDLIYPEYRSVLLDKWKKNIGLDLVRTDEYPIKTASGETKWVCEKFREVYDSERNVIATEGFIIDITERKNAEKSLQQSEERFRAIFEEAPLGIGIFDS